MSDGLPERLNAAEEEFGYPRVEAVFAEVAEETPDVIIQRLTAGGEDWAAGRRHYAGGVEGEGVGDTVGRVSMGRSVRKTGQTAVEIPENWNLRKCLVWL
jgi:hypothetical protein